PASFPSDTIEEYMPGGHEKPLTIALPRREVRASRRLSGGDGFYSRDLWRAWRARDCRSA
ncbi:unnamed protein product, partial [Ascophyllum nodosum]